MARHRLSQILAVACILIGLLAAIPILYARYQRETANRRVDLVVELPAFRTLAYQEGYPLPDLLQGLARAGITAAAVFEQDLDGLKESGDAAVLPGPELRARLAASAQPDPFLLALVEQGNVDARHTYVLPVSDEAAARLHRAAVLRLGADLVTWHRPAGGGPGVIELRRPAFLLSSQGIGFGFRPADFELVRAAGLRPVPRPRNAPAVTPDLVRSTYAELATLAPEANSVMFAGRQVLGYRPDLPAALDAARAEVSRRGLILDLIEHANQLAYINQDGQAELAAAADWRVARVYAMGQAEIDKFPPPSTVEKWVRSVVERNIRVLYLRPFFKWQDLGLSVIETNLKYFGQLSADLQQWRYPPGGPDVFATLFIPWWHKGLVGLLVVGAGLGWLGLTWPGLRPAAWLLLGAGGLTGSMAAARVAPNTGPQLLALGAAILFPTLAGTYLLARWHISSRHALGGGGTGDAVSAGAPTVIRAGAGGLLSMAGLSLLGGLAVAALLGDVTYMLEFVYFRGVKLSLAAPLLLVIFSWLVLGRPGSPLAVARAVTRDVTAALGATVRYWHVAVGLLGMVALFWLLQRSGNFPLVPVPDWEREIRAFLEQTLVARPRFKEFAIGYPALVLAAVAVHRGFRSWAIGLVLAGTLAGVSVVNSFSHLRTPWATSLLRTIHGLWLGAFIGLAGTVVLILVYRWLLGREEAT